MQNDFIRIKGARVHNLKNIDIDIPKNKLIVFTGLSGSGKSSLAFDTIFAEGQRRYIDSLSSYARQFLEMQEKPDIDSIEGLSPTIAIDQKTSSHNPRSTVGTVTEIYDFLRVLYARIAKPHHPKTGERIQEHSLEDLVNDVLRMIKKGEVILFIPMVKHQKGEHQHVLISAQEAGFKEVRFDGLLIDIEEAIAMKKQKTKEHTIDIVAEHFAKKEEVSFENMKTILERALDLGNNVVSVYCDDTGDEKEMVKGYHLPGGMQIPKPEPRLFSFNSPLGACPDCTGLGIKLVLEPDLVIANKRLTIAEGAIKPWMRISGNQSSYFELLDKVAKKHQFSLHKPIEEFTKKQLDILFHGTGEDAYTVKGEEMTFAGILMILEQKYKQTSSDYVRKELETYMRSMVCPECNGGRLRKEVLLFTIGDKTIADIASLALDEITSLFTLWKKNTRMTDTEKMIIDRIATEVIVRVEHLIEVGLGYLTLDRGAMTLSGGEAQRVRLATQLGSGLSGLIYVLDEPSIGLHPRDNQKLIDTVCRLRDHGNTIIVVEHDEEMIRQADYVFDIGPGAGNYGGHVVAQGIPKEIMKHKESLTGAYLSGRKQIPIPAQYRKGNKKSVSIIGATEHNLHNVSVNIPLGTLICVTGVSGSGKSTLILDILGRELSHVFYRAKTYPGAHKEIKGLKNIDKVVSVDQSPIGRTPRSNPATYTGVFTAIRDLFTEIQEAKIRGFEAGNFSFNVKNGGRCETCVGEGQIRIEMQFMPDVYVDCTDCHGTRYKQEVLDIHYRNKNISDILNMTVDEARRFFSDKSNIHTKLQTLYEVGLGYVALGQSATTLSGGEAQRVKLATELSRRDTGKTLYILDEPTTGLHFEDTVRLLEVLHALVDKGNTVLVIEHNIDMMMASDWIIDMGPEGGSRGGKVVGEGTPKQIAKLKTHTGHALKHAFLRKK